MALREAQPVSSLEQMRLGGREADVAAPLTPTAPAASPAPTPIATPTPVTARAAVAASELEVEEAKPSPLGAPYIAPPATAPQRATPPKPAKPTPKSAEHASAMSIAAALVRNDKAGPAEATCQRPPALKAPRGGHADDLTLIKGVGARQRNGLSPFRPDRRLDRG